MPADFNLRARLVPILRHEFGHWVLARILGFPTGAIFVEQEQAGSSIDLVPSIKSIDEAVAFLEKRIQVLYAGSLAQSLLKNKIVNDDAHRYLRTTAANDYAKARELGRMLTGMKYPDLSYSDFEERLKKIDQSLYERAGKAVQKYANLIADLAVFYVARYEAAWNADSAATGKRFELRLAEIETFPDLEARLRNG